MSGVLFSVDGKGPNEIEILMRKEYAKRFAHGLLEAIEKMDGGEDNIVFTFKGRPFAQKDVILSQIKEQEGKIIVH
jgi:hypothetical protein